MKICFAQFLYDQGLEDMEGLNVILHKKDGDRGAWGAPPFYFELNNGDINDKKLTEI